MSSSIFSSNPLIQDILAQRVLLKRYFLRFLLFCAVIFLADRGLNLLLLRGLDRYFGLDRPGVVLCVGHSRTVLGIDEQELERRLGVPVVKYAFSGANVTDRLAMIRHYFNRQPNSVRLVVYDVDEFTFTPEGLSSNSYLLLFPYFDDPDIRAYLRQYCSSRFEFQLRRVFKMIRYDETTLCLAVRGLMGERDNLKRGTVDIRRIQLQIARGDNRKVHIDRQSLKLFEQTVGFVHSQGAGIALAYIPVIDILNDADRSGQTRVLDVFRGYAARGSNTLFWDYNRDYEHKHEMFYDGIHMNPAGQRIITERLGYDIGALQVDRARSFALNKP